jgi:hypothetical protein
MEKAPFVKELQERIARIRAHTVASLDLLGFELAYDRGNITTEEFEAVKEKIDSCQRLIDSECAHIEELAAQHPLEFDRFLTDSCKKLRRILDLLAETLPEGDTFEKQFTRSLIPDLLEGLVARQQKQPSRHSFSWLLWVSADTLRAYPELPPASGGPPGPGGVAGSQP